MWVLGRSMEPFLGTVAVGFSRFLARVNIDDLDRDDWRGAIRLGQVSPVETELRPGLTLVQIAEPCHPRAGQVALAVIDTTGDQPKVLVLSGEFAFRNQPLRLRRSLP
jgi:hypothetical protein